MLRQPLQRLYSMQASDIDIYRKVTREKTHTMAKYLALHTKKTEEEIVRDFARPRYFTPYEAVGYGLIDTVRGPVRTHSPDCPMRTHATHCPVRTHSPLAL